MALFNRTKTVEFSAFMDGSYKMTKDEKQTIGAVGVAATVGIVQADRAYAGVISDGIENRIIESFQPFIDMIQGMCYPVGFLMMSAGMLLVMLGQKHRGMAMMKWAGIGYVGFQFVPIIMQILAEVSTAMVAK